MKTGWKQNNKIDAELNILDDFLFTNIRPPILNIDNLTPTDSTVLKEANKMLQNELKKALDAFEINKNVRIVWTQGDTLSASAIALESCNEFFITFSIGTIKIISYYYRLLFANRNFCKDIGKIHLEKLYDGLDINKIYKANELETYPDPVCPIRLLSAQLMSGHALKFLLLHEVIHLAHGHLDLNMHHLDTPHTENYENIDKELILKSHITEIDADIGASSYFADYFMQNQFAQSPSNSVYCQHEREVYGHSDVGSSRYFGLIIGSLFLLLYPNYPLLNSKSMLNGSHPHPGIRHHFASSIFAVTATRYKKFTTKDERISYKNKLIRLMNNCLVDCCNIIFDKDNSIKFYKIRSVVTFLFTVEANTYEYLLMKKWSELYPIYNSRKISPAILNLPLNESTLKRYENRSNTNNNENYWIETLEEYISKEKNGLSWDQFITIIDYF